MYLHHIKNLSATSRKTCHEKHSQRLGDLNSYLRDHLSHSLFFSMSLSVSPFLSSSLLLSCLLSLSPPCLSLTPTSEHLYLGSGISL